MYELINIFLYESLFVFIRSLKKRKYWYWYREDERLIKYMVTTVKRRNDICICLLAGVGMFKIGGSVVVYLTGIGLLDIARSSFGPSHVPPFLEDVLEGVPELVAKPEQEHRLVPTENRELQLPEQVSQPFGGQAEKVVEEG